MDDRRGSHGSHRQQVESGTQRFVKGITSVCDPTNEDIFSNVFLGSVVFVFNVGMKDIFSDAHANTVKQNSLFVTVYG